MDFAEVFENGEIGQMSQEWLLFSGATERGDFWFHPDAVDPDQHHPLQGGLPYMLLPVAAGLSACGYMAKIFAHRRLAARARMGLREYAEDDISICSGSMFSEGSLDTRSYLSAKTTVSLRQLESYDELATLLSTYHLDNTSQLSNANSNFSSWAFATSYGRDPSCASSSASSACSSSGHSHGPCSSPSTLSNTSGVLRRRRSSSPHATGAKQPLWTTLARRAEETQCDAKAPQRE